ncbi:Osiris 17 [Carabus blaptoides fortunei]
MSRSDKVHGRQKVALIRVSDVATISAYDNETASDQSESYNNITGGNRLWNGLLRDCKTPSMTCIQKNVYHYLDDTFGYRGDVNIGNIMQFKRNTVDYSKYTKESNNYVDDDEEDEEHRSRSPLEEVTDALHGKSMAFMMTHDMQLKMPDTLFEGSTLKVSPRAFEGDGVIVKLDLIPKEIQSDQAVGRIFFKKIKKFFKNKLLMAFMSIVLVIGLIKTKLMFLMPVIVGVGTAKKILLKVLLFIFPALSHIFKLCTYYHDSYHNTKYHHHHHQIAHIHHMPPPSLHHHAPDILSHGPPPGHHFKHEHDDFEFSGPGLGPEYISNRNALEHTPSLSDENELKSWGLGHVQGHKGSRRGQQPKPPSTPLSDNQIDELALQAEREVMLKARLQEEQQRIRQQNMRLQEQLKHEIKMQDQLRLHAMMIGQQTTKLQPKQSFKLQPPQFQGQFQPPVQSQFPPAPNIPTQIQLPPQQQQLPPQDDPQIKLAPSYSPTYSQQTITKASYDPFYSPILEKIDKILNSLGVSDEPCRERLICSIYKNPVKFSPHSNLLSAELSRDSKDLQKPTTNNEAVIRFYRYVQAARDGQDQRECLRLYPSCNINTEL